MSIFNYLFDSEWSQRSDIEHLKERSRRQRQLASRSARRNASKVQTLEAQVEELQEEVGALQLITRALLQTLEATPDWDAETFKAALQQIDLEDGIEDGKAPPAR